MRFELGFQISYIAVDLPYVRGMDYQKPTYGSTFKNTGSNVLIPRTIPRLNLDGKVP